VDSGKRFFFVSAKMTTSEIQELSTFLAGFVAEKRLQRFEQVLEKRLSHLHIVLENLFQAHNASAVLRSCDCFGVQNVHFIENHNRMRISDDVAMGSSQWLTVRRYKEQANNTRATLQSLKAQGFKIIATSPHKDEHTLKSLPLDQKVALVFGTEQEGISQEVMEEADGFVSIPMMGFTESFNVSVCAALCMYELSTRIRSEVPSPYLSDQEKAEVRLQWISASVDNSAALIRRFSEDKKSGSNSIRP
jgi:tRNA (guanosine-2'-O-)-methyltransferase